MRAPRRGGVFEFACGFRYESFGSKKVGRFFPKASPDLFQRRCPQLLQRRMVGRIRRVSSCPHVFQCLGESALVVRLNNRIGGEIGSDGHIRI